MTMGMSYIINTPRESSSDDTPQQANTPHTAGHTSHPRTLPEIDLATVAEESSTATPMLNLSEPDLSIPDCDPPPYIDRARLHRFYNISSADLDTVKAMVEHAEHVDRLAVGEPAHDEEMAPTPPLVETGHHPSFAPRPDPTMEGVQPATLLSVRRRIVTPEPTMVGNAGGLSEVEEFEIDEDQIDSSVSGSKRPVFLLDHEELLRTVKRARAESNPVHAATWAGIVAGSAAGALVGSAVTLFGLYRMEHGGHL